MSITTEVQLKIYLIQQFPIIDTDRTTVCWDFAVMQGGRVYLYLASNLGVKPPTDWFNSLKRCWASEDAWDL